jgi:DNA-binding beta-propeller fold protein YncE
VKRGRVARRTWLLPLLAAGLFATLAIATPASGAIVQKAAWGSGGSGAGQFGYAQGIATDSRGHVYVTDLANNRIEKFSAAGRFLLTWGWGVEDGASAFETCRSSCQAGIGGSGEGQFSAPVDLAFDSADRAYVADSGNNRIQKFTASGRFLTKWGHPGSDNGEFGCYVDDHGDCDGGSPRGVAVSRGDRVWVTDDANRRTQKFSPNGRFLAKVGATAYYVAADSADHIYIQGGDSIDKFSAGGRFLLRWGWGVRYGLDRFERCGPPTPRVGCSPGISGSGKGQFNGPEGIATDDRGHVYVADSSNERIQKFSASGRFLTTWGEFGHGEGQFEYPTDIAVDSAGHVYVADAVNDRIVKYAQVPPQTTITSSKVARRQARFSFNSSEPHSHFKCKLDHGAFGPCDSPKVYRRLSAGSHTFRVRAIDADHLKDPKAAKKWFSLAK